MMVVIVEAMVVVAVIMHMRMMVIVVCMAGKDAQEVNGIKVIAVAIPAVRAKRIVGMLLAKTAATGRKEKDSTWTQACNQCFGQKVAHHFYI